MLNSVLDLMLFSVVFGKKNAILDRGDGTREHTVFSKHDGAITQQYFLIAVMKIMTEIHHLCTYQVSVQTKCFVYNSIGHYHSYHIHVSVSLLCMILRY